MKNESLVAFNVRLNLNKLAHRQAWEYLQSRRTSYSETCVAAINVMADSEAFVEVKRAIGGIVRDAVADVLRQIPMTALPAAIDNPNDGSILSDDDFDIADEFMNSL